MLESQKIFFFKPKIDLSLISTDIIPLITKYLRPATLFKNRLTLMFFCEFCEIFKSTFYTEHLLTPASACTHGATKLGHKNYFTLFCNISKSTRSQRRCSLRKGVLRNFAKLTWKYLCQGLFFNKVAGLSPELYFKRDYGTGVFL